MASRGAKGACAMVCWASTVLKKVYHTCLRDLQMRILQVRMVQQFVVLLMPDVCVERQTCGSDSLFWVGSAFEKKGEESSDSRRVFHVGCRKTCSGDQEGGSMSCLLWSRVLYAAWSFTLLVVFDCVSSALECCVTVTTGARQGGVSDGFVLTCGGLTPSFVKQTVLDEWSQS